MTATAIGFGATFHTEPASAQFFQFYEPASPPRRATRIAKPRKPVVTEARAVRRETSIKQAAASGTPPEALLGIVSLAQQRLHIYGRNGVVAQSRVSTGQPGHSTPAGVYSIIQRHRYHESNIYSGAPMPFMQRITWSGIALHAGVVPGYPASHGCIRLPSDFAPQLWNMTRIGTRVLVVPQEVSPVEVRHARLPEPAMTPVPMAASPTPVTTASTTASLTGDEAQRLLDPYQLAQFRKARSAADAAMADKAVQPAFATAQQKSAEASRAGEALKAAEAALAEANDRLLVERAAMAGAQTEAAEAPVKERLQKAQADVEAAETAVKVARIAEASASDDAFAAARAARDAEAYAATQGEEAKLAASGLEPVSIFVSRKEGRVFVRQGFTPLLDEPITFAEPDRPLGTHIFTAIDALDGGAKLRWLAVTFPGGASKATSDDEQRRPRRKSRESDIVTASLPASDASEALDRFEWPDTVKKLIADRLWPGSSLIVSDFGPSLETGRGTDFVIQPK